MENTIENSSSHENSSYNTQKTVDPYALEPISFNELETVVKKWLLVEDQGIIKVICATLVANRLPTNPVWLFLVAPSGGGKTEFIKALKEIPYVYALSTLTPQTFLSGLRGSKDASLLPKINNHVVTFKDFTTILQSHPQAQSEILAQLREIYDGHYKKDFGTGDRKEWEGKIGFIAGVTSIIDRYHNVHKSLGERFLQYRIVQPDKMAVMDRVEENTLKKDEMDKELARAFKQFMYGMQTEISKKLPPIPLPLIEKMKKISLFVSVARSAVIRNPFQKQIEFIPAFEMTTRIYSQMSIMAKALMIINKRNELNDGDFIILFKLGFDSIHYLRRMTLETLRQYKGWVKTQTVAVKIGYSTTITSDYLEDVVALGLAERAKPRENLNLWRLKPLYRDIWRECELKTNPIADGVYSDEDAEKEAENLKEEGMVTNSGLTEAQEQELQQLL